MAYRFFNAHASCFLLLCLAPLTAVYGQTDTGTAETAATAEASATDGTDDASGDSTEGESQPAGGDAAPDDCPEGGSGTPECPVDRFTGEGGLGFITTSGNTDSESYNANLKAKYIRGRWRYTFGIDAKETTEDGELTSKRFLFNQKSGYDFTPKTYWFSAFRYDEDRFSGFEYQASGAFGIGRHLIDREHTLWDMEVGAGYKADKLEQSGEVQREEIARFYTLYETRLTDNSHFSQALLVEGGEENTVSESTTALKLAVNDSLALRVSHTVKKNSNPPFTAEPYDRTTAIALVYGF